MDLEQEQTMLRMIEHMLKRYIRPEKLVMFNGLDHTFVQQIELLQSANLVIGAHGGGMANLLFLLPSGSCQERPKALEFVANSIVPEVQHGGLGRSYYRMYSTCPWAEYHHIIYAPHFNGRVTYVKLEEYREALNVLFRPQEIGQGQDPTQ
jgi:capsular polysaccharide biosynthesis protein